MPPCRFPRSIVALVFQGPLVLFGPVFSVELLTGGRRARFMLVRMGYAALLFMGLWITYESVAESFSVVSLRQAANVAGYFFHVFAWGQLSAVLLVAPALAAGAIAEERERRTLEYLLASDLRDAEIVLSKYASRVLLSAAILLAGVPVLQVSTLMGGVSPTEVWQAFLITASTLLMVASVALAMSVRAARTRDAIQSIYRILFAWFAIPVILRIVWIIPWFAGLGWLRAWISWLDPLLVYPNPFLALWQVLYSFRGGRGINPWVDVGWLLATQGCITLACLAAAVVGVRRVQRRFMGAPVVARTPWHWRRRPPIGENALRWKERYTEGRLRLTPTARVAQGLVLLGIAAAVVWQFVVSIGMGSFGPFADSYLWSSLWGGMVVACAGVILTAARAATLITSERERDTWISLIASPLTGRDIIRAKIGGGMWAARGVWLLLALIWTPAVLLRPAWIWVVALQALALAGLLWYASALGVWFSLRGRNTMRAIAATIGTLLVIGGGFWFCCGPCLATMGPSGPEEIMLLLLAPVAPFLLAAPGVVFLEGMPHFRDVASIAIVAFWLGVVGYPLCAMQLSAWAIDDFDSLAGRITIDVPPTRKSPSPSAAP